MASLIPLAGLVGALAFFYYVFTSNPRRVLDYFRITLMGVALVLVFGLLMFREYSAQPLFEGDSVQEIGQNFMRFLYKYGVYLLFFTISTVIFLGLAKLAQKGFLYSSESPWITVGLVFLLLALVQAQMGTRTFDSGLLNFIRNVILYLPCILTDLIHFLKKDYANTPSTTLIVSAILLVYILVFYLVPFLYKVQYQNEGIQLISEPIYLRDPMTVSTEELNERILKGRPFYDRWFQQILLHKMATAEKAYYTQEVKKKSEPRWIVPPDEITRAYYEGREGFTQGSDGFTQGSEGFTQGSEGFTSLGNEDKQLIPYEVFKHRIEEMDESLPPYERYMIYILNHPKVMYVREKLYYIYASGYAGLDALLYTLPKISTSLYYYHYALSSWIYLHRIQSNQYQLLYSFGTRPSLYFDPLESALLVILDYGLASQRILYKTTTVLYQRWNYIVMNYNYGSLDLFINNRLVGTYPDVLTYLRPDDLLIVGSRDNKNIGGVCNMKYYELPLSIRKIDQIYQRFHRKKIPI